jgi:hypothetical protein
MEKRAVDKKSKTSTLSPYDVLTAEYHDLPIFAMMGHAETVASELDCPPWKAAWHTASRAICFSFYEKDEPVMAKSVDWNWEACLTKPQVAALNLLRNKIDRLEAQRADLTSMIDQLLSRASPRSSVRRSPRRGSAVCASRLSFCRR